MLLRGPFEVTLTPEPLAVADARRGRLSIAKRYHGDLEATGTGEMLSGGDPSTGSAAYVAIETVVGKLGGRDGGFQLVHRGTMDSGDHRLEITVVPGSGTDELAGLTGRMTIEINPDRTHVYMLDCELPSA